MAAIIANQRGADMEGVIYGQVLLGLPWDLVLLMLGINAWYGPYLYALAIAVNAAILYVVILLMTKSKNQK